MLRKTARRGRSGVPVTLTRTRLCRFRRLTLRSVRLITRSPAHRYQLRSCCGFRPLAGLPGLAADLLAAVHDALALVRLGRPEPAEIGGHLSDVFVRDAGDRELGRVLHVDRDALGRFEPDGMRVAEAQHQLVALLRDAIADTNQLEVLDEARVDARHHVGDEAADKTVQGAMAVPVGRALEHELTVDLLDRDVCRQGALELALRPLDLHMPRLQGDLHRARQLYRQLSNARQLFFLISYQTNASTSPPSPWRVAWRPLMTPSAVLRIAIPSPPRTLGISVLRA